jgi:fatty acid desaturase
MIEGKKDKREILKRYWRLLACGGILTVGWYFAGGPLWAWIILALVIYLGSKLTDYLGSKLTDAIKFALFVALVGGGVAFYFTSNLTLSLIVALLLFGFYFGLKWVENVNERRSARKQEPQRPIIEYRPISGKCVLPGGVDFPLPDHVQRAIDDEK